MRLIAGGVIASVILVAGVAGVAPVSAQEAERVWERGTVWNVSYVETKPGKFNAYIKDLSNVWRTFLEEQKKTGDVVSYKMLAVDDPRDGEPNLILLVESKNMAVFDRSLDSLEEMSKKIMGSLDAAQQATIKRGDLRTLRGSVLAREIRFKQ